MLTGDSHFPSSRGNRSLRTTAASSPRRQSSAAARPSECNRAVGFVGPPPTDECCAETNRVDLPGTAPGSGTVQAEPAVSQCLAVRLETVAIAVLVPVALLAVRVKLAESVAPRASASDAAFGSATTTLCGVPAWTDVMVGCSRTTLVRRSRRDRLSRFSRSVRVPATTTRTL